MCGLGHKHWNTIKKGADCSTPSILYPDPGSNRDGLLHWCLRPARLPIPPSGHCDFPLMLCKGMFFFLCDKKTSGIFEKKHEYG